MLLLPLARTPAEECKTEHDQALTTLLQVLRLQYEKEMTQAYVSVQTKFNYAWGLVKSPRREHQVEGVRLLQGALHNQNRGYTKAGVDRGFSSNRDIPL